MSEKQTVNESKSYSGTLTAPQAATAIQAARLNALDLLDSADILFTLKRFPHSAALSTLAIEESAKPALLLLIFLGLGGEQSKMWKSYRQHRAKTGWLNPAIESTVRANFPEIPPDEAKTIGLKGPTPDDLEASKQLAFYSDCLDVSGSFVCHLPKNVDWRKQAWERLCEARALASALRDYPPEELEIWLKHAGNKIGRAGVVDILPQLHKELQEKGFIKEGWWDTLLQDLRDEIVRSGESMPPTGG